MASLYSTAMNYKTVASLEKLHASHDIVISDFIDWRENNEFFGEVKSPFFVSSFDACGKEKAKV